MKSTMKKLTAVILVILLASAELCAFAKPLSTIKLPDALKIIEDEAFQFDTSIKKVIITPETIDGADPTILRDPNHPREKLTGRKN